MATDIEKKRASSRKYSRSAKGRARDRRWLTTPRGREISNRGAKGRRLDMRAMLHALKTQPCLDCGGTFDPVCMDFDHRPGEVKLFGVGSGLSHATSVILAEIAKCDIVCGNCHRLRTHRLRDHSKTTIAPKISRPSPQLRLVLELTK